MATKGLAEVIRAIRKERERIWLRKPEDIGSLKRRIGARKQNFTTVMYADTDTQAMVKYLYNLRDASKIKGVDLPTLKRITEIMLGLDQRRAVIYYHLQKTAQLLEMTMDALKRVRTVKGYQSLIGEVLLYIGKLNYWIDLEIPWSRLAKAFRTS